MSNVTPILRKALLYGAASTLIVAVLGSALGYFTAGPDGVITALVGAGLAAVFMGLTAASILLAGRLVKGGPASAAYYGIVLGVWSLKLVLFLLLALAIRDQPWLNAYIFFWVVIAAVIGSLIADALALQRSRVPYVGDIDLPRPDGPVVRPPGRAG